MFDRKTGLYLALLVSQLFVGPEPVADLRADIHYSLALEAHTEEDDREISGLHLSLNQDYSSRNVTFFMELEAAAYTEHGSSQDNETFLGNVDSTYYFLPSTYWVADVEFAEIAAESAEEIDVLNSQTVTTLSTGPGFRYSHELRGTVFAELLAIRYEYDEAVIDGDETSFSLGYEYPLQQSLNLITSLNISEQRYDRSAESINDARTEGVRLSLIRSDRALTYEIFVEQTQIEFLNQEREEDDESYGFLLNYEINSRSNAIFEVSETVEQTLSLNQDLSSPTVPVLSSGLVEIKAVSIQYIYRTNRRYLSGLIFRNDIRNLSDFGVNDGLQTGLDLEYRENFSDKWRMVLSLERVEEEVVDTETETFIAELDYNFYESSRVLSSIYFIVEERDEDGVDDDDASIEWVTRIELY